MTQKEQVKHFSNELDKFVERFTDEFDISYAALIGVLQIKVHELCSDVIEPEEDDLNP